MGPGSPTLAAVLSALALTAAGCGGDNNNGGSGEESGSSDDSYQDTETTETSDADAGCEDVYGHPSRQPANPPGYVVACSAPDGHSLHVENVSAQVLRVWPTHLNDGTKIGLEVLWSPSPGVGAARIVTGAGWATDRTFVLPPGYSLTATNSSLVSLQFKSDLSLSATANSARYVAEWVASKLRTRGQALAQKVQDCATSVSQTTSEGAQVEDVLHDALGTRTCFSLLDDVLREEGADPATELPRARKQVLGIAKPVLEDELISRAAHILAHR